MRLVKQLMVIINPISGTRSKKGIDEAIRHEATHYGLAVDIRFTKAPHHATELAKEAIERGYYGVIACGGDGTVNEIARAVIGKDIVMGIIPNGSGNGLARHLNLPMTLKGAMKVIAADKVLNADYATANGEPFFCTFGIGFDADVTYKFSRSGRRGLSTYLQTTLDEAIQHQPEEYKIMADGHVITEEATLVACCNASQYGNNAYIAPTASIKDGLIDITIIHKGSLFQLALAAIDVLAGLVGKTANASTFRTRTVTIERKQSGPAHLDGEPAMMDALIEVKVHPGELKLFSNPRKDHYRALMSPKIPFISPFVLTMQDVGYKAINLFRR
ncbi:MAG: diacylglycerol kinase family lipid kinase [Muribaculaceae bacterium]|nr:diacylglycerol kinase family lipid kinase [Muribaculaceae bacterium]